MAELLPAFFLREDRGSGGGGWRGDRVRGGEAVLGGPVEERFDLVAGAIRGEPGVQLVLVEVEQVDVVGVEPVQEYEDLVDAAADLLGCGGGVQAAGGLAAGSAE
ncbi:MULTISPECIES: hypothetical protein [unclassified Kitasatospora]|uniref:hypothetical protein n=1 Tax=unclassified Kitasatospora TaxID=2633591 RepID=UPI0033D4671F